MSDSPVPFRVGQALDVHAFASAESVAARPGRVMMLACLEWPGEVPLEGHSDGDVAAHAVCDAVLAATGPGRTRAAGVLNARTARALAGIASDVVSSATPTPDGRAA